MNPQWPKIFDDGYKLVPDKVKGGDDLWNSDEYANSLDSCKAACNANSRCTAIAWEKSRQKCWLKSQRESDGGFNTNSNFDTWFKQGEPALDKKLFIRTANKLPVQSWRHRGLFDISSGGCENGAVNVGGCSTGGDDSCSLVPISKEMCPAVGDLVYFRHEQIGTGTVEDYDWGAWARWGDRSGRYCTRFSDPGSELSKVEFAPILCGYNRIDKDKWATLTTYGFTQDEKRRVIKEHCEGPGVTSKELAADSEYCGNSRYANEFSNSEYNQAILNKLKTEPNWWNDEINCTNFQNIIINKKDDQAIMRVAGELIDTLPNTGWSDYLVKAINAIKRSIDGALDVKLDDKSKAYCDASSGDTNSKCGCRNAIKYGATRQCTNNIQGCTDVKRSYDLIDKAKGINAEFGRQIEAIYSPNDDAEACKQSATETNSTIINIGNTRIRNTNIAACFTEIENSGTISGDVSTKCNASVRLYNESLTSSSGNTSSDDKKTEDEEKGTLVSGETAGIKNDYWLALCLCCICFLIIGIGLAAFLI